MLGEFEVLGSIPGDIKTLNDPEGFSKEIVSLWKKRKMKGIVFRDVYQGKTVSYILLEIKEGVCTIRGFYTVPEYRGKGIGSELLMFLVSFINPDIDIWVNITNTPEARKLYQKAGFRELYVRSDFPDQIKAYHGPKSDAEVLAER